MLTPDQLRILEECSMDETALVRLIELFESATSGPPSDGVFESSPIGIALVSPEGKFLKINQSLVEMFGYTSEELLSMDFQQITHLNDLASDLGFVQQTLRGERATFRMTKRYLHKNGQVIWCLLGVSLVRDNKGNPLYFVSQIQDISEQKQIEEELRQEKERLHTILDHMPVMLDAFDDNFNIMFWNRECERVTGYSAQEIVGNPYAMHLLYPEGLDEMLDEAGGYGGNFRGKEWRLTCKDGSKRTVAWSSVSGLIPIPTWPNWAVGVDVTERRQAQEALIEQEKLTVSLQKEQELSQLKSTMMMHISHEFRTPLAIMATACESLIRYYERVTPERWAEWIEQIQKQIWRLTDMLNDISFLVRGEFEHLEFEPEPFDLLALCEKISSMLASTVQRRYTITFNLDPRLRQVNADSRLLTAALANLLSNAIKYSSLETPITLEGHMEGDTTVLRIRDEGVGIPEADRPRIFEPFYRGSNIGEIGGIGMGLNIVKEAVELHGGTLQVDSEVGKGTTFTIRLPHTGTPG